MTNSNMTHTISNSAQRIELDDRHRELKSKLILAGKVLVSEGQDDFTRGHISARLPDDPSLFFMKAHSTGLDEISFENILTIDLDGNVVAGTAKRHSEVYIHTEIYKWREDVQCVLHTHPVYATALSNSGRPLAPSSQPGALFYQALNVYEASINLVRSAEMGADVALALDQNRAVLLRGHGAVTAAPSIAEAVISMLMLENAAMIQMISDASGAASTPFSEKDVMKLQHDISRPEQFSINFDYLCRRVQSRA